MIDPQSSPSVSTPLQQLTSNLDLLVADFVDFVEKVKSATELSIKEVLDRVESANRCARDIRIELEQIMPSDSLNWSTRDQLNELIDRTADIINTQDLAARKRRLLSLARDLKQGTIIHRRKERLIALQGLRDAAVEELTLEADAAQPKTLPGPDKDLWLTWAWSLSEEENGKDLRYINSEFPKLDKFITNCEPSLWCQDISSEEPNENVIRVEAVPATGQAESTSKCPDGHSSPNESQELVLDAEGGAAQAVESKGKDTMAIGAEESSRQFPDHAQTGSDTATESRRTTVNVQQSESRARPLLRSFSEFRGSHWINAKGHLESAPWLKIHQFSTELNNFLIKSLRVPTFSYAWLCSRALESLDSVPFLPSELIEQLSTLWTNAEREFDPLCKGKRVELFSKLLDGNAVECELPIIRTQLFLESIRPAEDFYFSSEQIQQLLEMASFSSQALKSTVGVLLDLAHRGMQPLGYIRDRFGAAKKDSPEQVERLLREAREEFHVQVTRFRNAAGGKIQRTHCREAWATFIQNISADLQSLMPLSKGGANEWDSAGMQERIVSWLPKLEQISERFHARYDDLKKMERTAKQIADQARVVNRLMNQYTSLQSFSPPKTEELFPSDEIQLLSGLLIENADEDVCRSVLLKILDQQKTDADPHLDFVLSDFMGHPELLSFIESIAPEVLRDRDFERPVLSVRSAPDIIRAAAYCLLPVSEINRTDDLLSLFRESLTSRFREDLFGRFVGALPEFEQGHLRTTHEECIEQLFESVAEVRDHWQIADEIAIADSDRLRILISEAEESIQKLGQIGFEAPLLTGWIKELIQVGQHITVQGAANLVKQISVLPENRRRDAERAIEARRFADALLILGEQRTPTLDSLREVMWRPEAASYYVSPPTSLNSEKLPLCQVWRQGVTGKMQSHDSKLRKTFYEFVFSAKRKDKPLFKYGTSEATCFRMPSLVVRECIAFQKWNPSFVPQLADFREIVVLTPPVSPDQGDFVREAAQQVSQYKNAFCVLLAPHLSIQKREEIQSAWRKKAGVRAAVIDDLDLCRLIAPGKSPRPHPLLGILEIALEQQPWSIVDPFRTEDGQKIQMEMFVGRDREARQLALEKHYSRLFSGRKLGKSALLKYMQETIDGEKTASGTTIRIVYISIVGAHKESDVATRILSSLEVRFRFHADRAEGEDAGANLVETIKLFLKQHPSESFVFVLDEADNFVEAELDQYQKKREQSLSFRLRSELEDITDEMGHPRSRFVISGYRRTNTTDGAWANWGDVLRLVPLEPEDAAKLVAGPLARLGIDASRTAPAIAYRCGYQPAVLLRFGKVLLKRLNERRLVGKWEYLKVTPDDVSGAFNDPQVQEEVRLVVNNNFQQNPVARIIFNLIVWMLSEQSFGSGLQDAEEAVLECLKKVDSDLSWLQEDEGLARREVGREIRELVQRQLLTCVQEGRTTTYRLRFPHHLNILHTQDQLEDIAQEISALRARGGTEQGVVSQTILPATVVTDFNYLIRDGRSDGFTTAIIAVGTHWRTPLEHASAGIAESLNISAEHCFKGGHDKPNWKLDPIAILRSTPTILESAISARDKALSPPLCMGGADLLRWALERRHEGMNAEVAALGRISISGLRWWFEGVRGLDLPIPSAITSIQELTGGIPLLVGLMDRVLVGDTAGGVSLSKPALDSAFASFNESLCAEVSRLKDGSDEVKLTSREIQILCMACRVGETKNLFEDLTDYWDLIYRSDCPGTPDALTDLDWLSVSVVGHLGLLPCDRSRLGEPLDALLSVPPTDALRKMIQYLV
jgi:hypothetical protein